MTKNVGQIDKIIRIVVGLVLVAAGIFLDVHLAVAIVLFVLAAIAIVTALLGTCPAYKVFGINTCKTE